MSQVFHAFELIVGKPDNSNSDLDKDDPTTNVNRGEQNTTVSLLAGCMLSVL